MRYFITLLALLLFFPVLTANAAEGVECALLVHQTDSTGQNVLLSADTTTFVKGIHTSGFLLTFSLDIEFTEIDTTQCVFNSQIVTLGPQAQTQAKKFTVEYGLPAHMNDITGKNNNRYTLTIIPLAPYDIDTTACNFNHLDDSAFRFNPTAHTDLYYVPTSLADFYWTSVKELMEYEYRQFISLFNLNLPGKFQLFLCPCPIHSVIWDNRFGQTIIPNKNVGFAIYTKQVNTADPFILNHAAILRQFGYAPPFISEGLAGYLSFAIFDMKQLAAEHKTKPLSYFLDTYHYLKADPTLADRTAATFVKFLIDTYGIGRFKELYEKADDLSLQSSLTQIYSLSIEELEQQWLTFVDTLTIPLPIFSHHIDKAEVMMDYPLMLKYAKGMLPLIKKTGDSVIAYSALKRAYFLTGDYYGAAEAQRVLLGIDSINALGWMALAGYEMMNGLYDSARIHLEIAADLDPENAIIQFNLGLNYLLRYDTTTARQKFTDIIVSNNTSSPPEARIMLAELLRSTGNAQDKAKAMTYYNDALSIYQQQASKGEPMPTAELWMGIASLGLDDTGNAFNFLELANFLETRPFYLGMINLWLGKLADIRGDHVTAKNHYGVVLAQPSADYHQREARKYIENPYTR